MPFNYHHLVTCLFIGCLCLPVRGQVPDPIVQQMVESDAMAHLNFDTYHKMAKLVVASIAHLALSSEVGAANEVSNETPGTFHLLPTYPNPFKASTTIRYALPRASHVRLAIYDMLGREVRMLVVGAIPAGRHEATFEAGDLPSGLYVARLVTPQGTFTQKMLLLK